MIEGYKFPVALFRRKEKEISCYIIMKADTKNLPGPCFYEAPSFAEVSKYDFEKEIEILYKVMSSTEGNVNRYKYILKEKAKP